MLYVLKSPAYDGNGGYRMLIKIGFTTNWERRIASYILHNPTIKTLFLIKGGTLDDELSVCKYFQDYRYESYGTEWFLYSEEIIEFFEKHETIKSIRNSIPNLKRKVSKPSIISTSIVEHVVGIIEDVIKVNCQDLVKRILNEKPTTMSQILWFIRDNYPLVADEIINKTVEWYCINNKIGKSDCKIYSEEEKEILTFMNKFNSTYISKERLKILCTEKLSEPILSKILNLVPNDMKKFYTLLGPAKCEELNYSFLRLSREVESLIIGKEVISDSIYQEFSVGDIITKAEIKVRLSKLYKNLGYSASAKATDILEWFDTKRLSREQNGKRVDYFKLVKKL